MLDIDTTTEKFAPESAILIAGNARMTPEPMRTPDGRVRYLAEDVGGDTPQALGYIEAPFDGRANGVSIAKISDALNILLAPRTVRA